MKACAIIIITIHPYINKLWHLVIKIDNFLEFQNTIITIDIQRGDSNDDLLAFKSNHEDNWTFARIQII
jgi:hypothetical protein